jgi:magnesium transporter
MQETKYLLGRIKNKQDFVELEIDLYRNRMIRMNIDLTILATATGVTTALSGTFGMNMVNGFEESHTAFLVVSAASALTALSVAYYFRRMVSGRVIQQRAEQRINEIRTMSNALSDMTALDYTVKKMMRGTSMGREEFKQQLLMARQCKKRCSDKEIDLLFNVLNTDEDNVLSKDDFPDKRTMYGGKK